MLTRYRVFTGYHGRGLLIFLLIPSKIQEDGSIVSFALATILKTILVIFITKKLIFTYV